MLQYVPYPALQHHHIPTALRICGIWELSKVERRAASIAEAAAQAARVPIGVAFLDRKKLAVSFDKEIAHFSG